MRQRLDLRSADREIGVEEVGEPDAVGLGCQPQQRTVGVKAVGATRLDQFEGGFLAAIDEALGHPAVHTEDEIQGVCPKPGDLHDLGDSVAREAAEPGPGPDVIEGDHRTRYSAIPSYQILAGGRAPSRRVKSQPLEERGMAHLSLRFYPSPIARPSLRRPGVSRLP